MTTDLCPNCQHPRHLPGTECETRVHHGRNFHSCLCLARPGAALSCPPQMTCQGGTLGYSDVWYLQHGHSLMSDDGVISPEVLRPDPTRTAPAAAPVPPPADRATLREQIAEALISWTYRGKEPDPETGILETVRANAYSRADAVLAVLPEQTDQATLLREAADRLDAEAASLLDGLDGLAVFVAKARQQEAAVWRAAGDLLRRLAAEQPTETEQQAAAEYARALATPPSAEAAAYIRERLERPAVVEQPDTHTPRRGDQVEAWLKQQRDERRDDDHGQWSTLDALLDAYRLHADTSTPLSEHVCEGRVVGDCECLEQPDTQTREAR